MMIKSWSVLLLASALFGLFATGVIRFVLGLLRSNREQILATAALVPEQEVTIPEAGAIVLLLEVPRVGTAYRGLEFEVVEKATGQATKMKYEYLRAQGAVRGVTKVRIPLGRTTVQNAGALLIRISGLKTGQDYSGSSVLCSRPYLGRMVGQILGIVFCGIGLLLSLLFALWQLFPLQGGN